MHPISPGDAPAWLRQGSSSIAISSGIIRKNRVFSPATRPASFKLKSLSAININERPAQRAIRPSDAARRTATGRSIVNSTIMVRLILIQPAGLVKFSA